jgi:hypothetical protein
MILDPAQFPLWRIPARRLVSSPVFAILSRTSPGQCASWPGLFISSRTAPLRLATARRLILVVVAIIMGGAVMSSCAHIKAGMVPISVSLTDSNPDASDPNIDVFRDDNWFVANVQRTSKRRRCQERNKKKSKHSILHDILLGFKLRRMRAWYSRSLYRIDQLLVHPVLFERTWFPRHACQNGPIRSI